jgi:hypothetical protein
MKRSDECVLLALSLSSNSRGQSIEIGQLPLDSDLWSKEQGHSRGPTSSEYKNRRPDSMVGAAVSFGACLNPLPARNPSIRGLYSPKTALRSQGPGMGEGVAGSSTTMRRSALEIRPTTNGTISSLVTIVLLLR